MEPPYINSLTGLSPMFGQFKYFIVINQCPTEAAPFSPTSLKFSNLFRLNPVINESFLLNAIELAMHFPLTGVALKPQVPQPESKKNPSTGVVPMIGAKSGVMSAMPAHCLLIFTELKNGNKSNI